MKAPVKQCSQERNTSFRDFYQNSFNAYSIKFSCYDLVSEEQQASDEQPSFGCVQRQVGHIFLR